MPRFDDCHLYTRFGVGELHDQGISTLPQNTHSPVSHPHYASQALTQSQSTKMLCSYPPHHPTSLPSKPLSITTPDVDILVAVLLRVYDVWHQPPHTRRWALVWEIPSTPNTPYARINRLLHTHSRAPTNPNQWAPSTTLVTLEERSSTREYAISVMNLGQRRALERIAAGVWGCDDAQDWVVRVLAEAADMGLVERDRVQALLFCARED
ncbi:hypothetical protein JAAARDRAFT_197877 [Jaapia argillacea MUCL 33604]|uniref:Uncharacterized protein n=1 Tax=Jaapia argillacea MUCL 33604 TaxID=933084 RepID=A0A067PG15_9AGAM|nr:hypothetical protein JAAARDRAFT_197877 [Jaapia argillacea MUCL 33604]